MRCLDLRDRFLLVGMLLASFGAHAQALTL